MSVFFDTKVNGAQKLALNKQWNNLCANRQDGYNASIQLLDHTGETFGINRDSNGMTVNNLRVDEMYRAIDAGATGENRDWGSQVLLGKLLTSATPVNIGKQVVESRRYSEAGRIGRSMSGQTDIQMDNTQSNYQKTVVPIFDGGFGRDWREVEAMRSEALPALTEDSMEIEYSLLEDVNDYLWNGDGKLSFDGAQWGGLKGDSTIATHTITNDLTTSAEDLVIAELLAMVDVLRITNRVTGSYQLFVSPQVMSHWQAIAKSNTTGFMSILQAVRSLVPEFTSIEVDAGLQGNQAFASVLGTQGLHAKSGMAMSSYQMPRFKHNDPYQFVKWLAVGFQSKTTYSGRKCSVYAS
tara:strand:- start:4591 stop:5649 length:1059 start_codon:yes stop_codon:yes gene_type:complete